MSASVKSRAGEVCSIEHQELWASLFHGKARELLVHGVYNGAVEALALARQRIQPIWSAIAPHILYLWHHEATAYITWSVSIAWIPFVCFILEDRLEQVFLILYTITKLNGKRAEEAIGGASGGLWGLLLPSLVLASHALPSEPEVEAKSTRRWRILSITWHILVIYMEVNNDDIIDPSVESLVVGTMVLYIMSLDVYTGLSVISLLLMAVAVQMCSIVDLRALNTETVYAVLFALEHHFLSYTEDNKTMP